MADRRRINGPQGGTSPPVFEKYVNKVPTTTSERPARTRDPNVLRKMFLKTGVTPSASGSAYLELQASTHSPNSQTRSMYSVGASGLKMVCTVHGPHPLPRSAPFSPHTILTTHVKYAPFATRKRRGYLRDNTERDLAVHLETALRGVIIGDRWPKTGVDVIITILEGEEDFWWGYGKQQNGAKGASNWGMMSVLGGCITVASAAIVDAGIDCVDMAAGGMAALVQSDDGKTSLVLDPTPAEHERIVAACVLAYLPCRDEVTDIWVKGDVSTTALDLEEKKSAYECLTDSAVQTASASYRVLTSALKSSAERKIR